MEVVLLTTSATGVSSASAYTNYFYYMGVPCRETKIHNVIVFRLITVNYVCFYYLFFRCLLLCVLAY